DELLMMAVERTLLRVERHLHAGTPQVLCDIANLGARGPEERQRRSCPEEHAHLDLSRKLRQQVEQDAAISLAHERELGREVPTGDVDVRFGALELLGEPRQEARAVDQNLDVVAPSRRRIAVGPEARRRLERSPPTRPPE